ncbi:MAG: 5-bromo-4-chloroindolyl phosphate hydrolysis family protein [Azoarcus sp.]|jgi:5-bromo-4-chloroindolyl phosphate hydrolysis protein|nr:5-bromo-4-chloroindolyl phosphate hydrolysis family protein [Azoarcus sp.]
MPNSNNLPEIPALKTAAERLKQFGVRALVHLFSLIIAIFVVDSGNAPADANLFEMVAFFVSFKFSVYIGLICLVPDKPENRADWVIPSGAGIALLAAFALLGVPIGHSFIWGGAATWLIRFLRRKAKFNWELAVLPWLVISLFASHANEHVLGDMGLFLLLPVFLAISALGWAVTTFYIFFRTRIKERSLTPQEIAARDVISKIEEFKSSAAALQNKVRQLPEQIRKPVNGIVEGTNKILSCMRDDPNDVTPGERFLSRYLKASHGLVDEYARLSSQGVLQPPVIETLAKSESMLHRLNQAFEAEHAHLLTNDTLDFNADLNVLDKLLKIDGR